MKQEITRRINLLRSYMNRHQLAAFIIPTTDPHLSEYTASHWKTREWLTGFTGSAGTAVVTQQSAYLWTDSRYFLQAAQELEGTAIHLCKDGMPGTPSIPTLLSEQIDKGEKIAIDGKLLSVDQQRNYQALFSAAHLTLATTFDPFPELWSNRVAMPHGLATVYPQQYAGQSCTEKIAQLRTHLESEQCEVLLLSALDEIAWTLNIRGTDVSCNPVVISYLLITSETATLYISPEKVDHTLAVHLQKSGVTNQPYTAIDYALQQLKKQRVLLSPSSTNYHIYSQINQSCSIKEKTSPVLLLKAIRNATEIKGLHNAMVKDGVALTQFLHWLEEATPKGTETEVSIDQKLHSLRAAQKEYQGESFDTIAGFQANAAIVHYTATPNSCATLKGNGLLLIDSGAQYLDGTTDITRTIAIGEPTEEEKRDYTLVLKGHINLARCQFPAGTRGAQVDILARLPLWENGYNFFHGTGHGVGHFLNVHEGPQSIRMNENPIPLQPGMLTSNEPGLYKANRHGIRIENLLLVVPNQTTEFGSFYRFETVTLCPIDTKPILTSLLSAAEIAWLNQYHQHVYQQISAYLSPEDQQWLQEKTAPIHSI